MTADDIYTVAGSSSGASGYSGDGGVATSAKLDGPTDITFDSAGDLYIADKQNNRIQEVPIASGTQWGQSMTQPHVHHRRQLIGDIGRLGYRGSCDVCAVQRYRLGGTRLGGRSICGRRRQ